MGNIGLSVGDEILTYEEVVRLQPEERLKRPIVLIGECVFVCVCCACMCVCMCQGDTVGPSYYSC